MPLKVRNGGPNDAKVAKRFGVNVAQEVLIVQRRQARRLSRDRTRCRAVDNRVKSSYCLRSSIDGGTHLQIVSRVRADYNSARPYEVGGCNKGVGIATQKHHPSSFAG